MIGTSLPEYVFIRTSIFFLQYTTPICVSSLLVHVAIAGKKVAFSWPGGLVAAYALLDGLYALCIYYPHNRRLKQAAEHPPLQPRSERRALFQRCLDNTPDPAAYLRLWFLGADESEIQKENLHEFFSWAFLDKHPGNETAAEQKELDEYIAETERRIGHRLQPGRGKAKSLRLTLDDIDVQYRSVIWYLIVWGVDLITHIQLSRQEFQYYAQPRPHSSFVVPPRLQSLFPEKRSISQLSYWYRPHTAKDKLPLVFLHGIGIGLWPYTEYLSYLNEGRAEDDQIGIIAIEYLPVSMRFTNAPLTREEFLSQITLLIDAHGWDQFALLGHSYGTALATSMLKSPELNPRIQSVVLVDPISILLHLPDIAYNFTRRKPRRANEYLLWYFASTDPGAAHCLGRHFFWKDNIAWKEDLLQITGNPPAKESTAKLEGSGLRKVAVCLAERDLIVDTPTVWRYLANDENWMSAGDIVYKDGTQQSLAKPQGGRLENNGIEIVWFDGLDHAQAFDRKETSARLAAVTRRICTQN
ncbi:hypothetical protein F4777DRAFT_535276 [Nemania sp. FL0916]|nr:hypothetical protein F4777DRAFT_535276 [Nemania sp. FL0916]